ncbi:TraR/DksA family transcriptional regulator [Desulfovibrio ferrophilus]|uniref:Transcriptional regulator, TraR/DksA family n=1 Tax=Desulfovibrio ferrophilus TaxID=241368 RepID=A0A2Z6B0T0_9BACT|nr:TraR/DksA family transcriptional regulator [Desulfovibrio ferrophilus]BBD09119.1 transcriptional regulator, TraR/DksA family [Desulfovibrio ferrophilus]
MNEKQKNDFKEQIRKEIESLSETITGLAENTGPVEPDVAIGRLSRLDTMLNQGINEASIAKGRERLRKLEATLSRVDDDEEFGFCSECGDPIPLARLLAIPECITCVECAE